MLQRPTNRPKAGDASAARLYASSGANLLRSQLTGATYLASHPGFRLACCRSALQAPPFAMYTHGRAHSSGWPVLPGLQVDTKTTAMAKERVDRDFL